MTNRFATLTSRLAVLLTMALTLAACGGGGGGGGGGGFLGGDGSDSDTYYIEVTLNGPDGNPTSTVNPNAPGTLQILVLKNGARGAPVADVIVRASTDSGLLSPSSGSGLTNDAGLVTFTVFADEGAGRGAGVIVVEVEDPNGAVLSESINFQLGVASLRLGYLKGGEFFNGEIGIEPQGTIPARGEAVLSLAIVDENDQPVSFAETLVIESECLATETASTDPAGRIPVVAGRVQVIYTADGCVGIDELRARIVGESATATGIVEVADPAADGLTFVSAEPNLIVLKGTGGGSQRQERSKVTFQAVDARGTPQEGVEVRFDLTTDVGGLTTTPLSALTDAEGFASTNVFAGNVATVVRVIATLDSNDGLGEISTVSDVLTVSTGLPDQNSISLSVQGSFVVEEALTTDGVTRNITVRMADKFNNPVPDGTAAVFTTEYGAIQPSCETSGGACTVVWTSQDPRSPTLVQNQEVNFTIYNWADYNCPSHNGTSGPCPDRLIIEAIGRSTILVTAIGEESFIDRNGNGIFDQSEAEDGLWANLTEAFLDTDESGFYNPATEFCAANPDDLSCSASEDLFTDFNSNGIFDANGDDPNNGYPDEGVEAQYNGLLCPPEGDGVWCSRSLVNVRDSALLVMSSGPNWGIELYRGRTRVNTTTFSNTYTAYVSDLFNHKPPANSRISVSATAPCEVEGEVDYTVPNTTASGAEQVQFTQTGEVEYNSCEDSNPDVTGTLDITLSPTGGTPFSRTYTCRARAVDTAPRDELGGVDCGP